MLFLHGAGTGGNEAGLSVASRLDPFWLDAHFPDQPNFHHGGAVLAEDHIGFVGAEGIRVAFDDEVRLRIPPNEEAQLLQARHGLFVQAVFTVCKKQIARHENGSSARAEGAGLGQEVVEVAESRCVAAAELAGFY